MKLYYNLVIFTGDTSKGNKGYITYHNITNYDKTKDFIDQQFPEWKFMHRYNHATRKFIDTIFRA